MIITFGVILFFSCVREGIEDYKRYKKDRKANNVISHIYDRTSENKGFEAKASKKLHVGDIIKIYNDEEVSADVCLLKSSNVSGICFVDTVNLDGESNLKDKRCNHKIQNLHEYYVLNVEGRLICDKPNDQLDYWEASFITTINNVETKLTFEYLIYFNKAMIIFS